MTRLLAIVQQVACFTALSLCFACKKEHCMRTYTYYLPIYQNKEEAYAGIEKNSHPRDIARPGKLVVNGSYIFLNDYNSGIHIIDNSNPSKPYNKAFIKIPGNIDMAVKGNILYADFNTDLLTIDISDVEHVKILDRIRKVFPWRYNMVNTFLVTNNNPSAQVYCLSMPDTSKVIADWIRVDTTIDCNYTANRSPITMEDGLAAAASSNAASTAGSMASFAITGSYLYALAGWELKTFDLAVPQHPLFSSSTSEFNTLETIFPFSNRLFVGSPNGMFIYSISTPSQPVKEGVFAHATVCDPVITDGRYAYVTLRSGTTCSGYTNQLDILDIANVTAPTRIKSYNLFNPHGLSKDGNTLFICDGKQGLKVYDAGDGKNITMTSHIEGMEAYDVIAQNRLAIISAADGLYQYDYSNRNKPQWLSKIGWHRP